MFEEKMIQSDVLEARRTDKSQINYSMNIRLPFYRSVPLSCIEAIEVMLDDQVIEAAALRFGYGNQSYRIDELGDLMHIWWGLRVPARLSIEADEAIDKRQVKASVTLKLRWPILIPSGDQELVNFDTNICHKVLQVSEAAYDMQAIKAKQAVSIYSFTKEFYEGYYSLEDCFRQVADLGIQGLEIVNTQHIDGFPKPSQSFIDAFNELVDRYGLIPVSYGTYTDSAIRTNGRLTQKEMCEQLETDIRLAKTLGFPLIRVGPNTPIEVLREILPQARKSQVKIGVEIHAPISVNDPLIEQLIEMIKQGNADSLGLVPDFSCFAQSVPGILLQKAIGMGVPEDIARFIASAYGEGVNITQLKEEAHRKGLPAEVDELIDLFYHLVVRGTPDDLKAVMPYVNHIHAKFWDLDENDDEVSVPYEALMKIIAETGYSDYISSEYEGYDVDTAYRGKAIVKRHQNMMQKYLSQAVN